jgi:alanyl-tRNA synthetase
LIISDNDGKVAVAAAVTSDLVDRLSAVDLVKASVPELGGKGGGGRAEFAQGGGQDMSKADAAIAAAEAAIKG